MKKTFATLMIGLGVTALSLGLAAGTAGAKEWKKVRIATEGAYAPWNATDASGKLIGFEVDLAGDLCRRMAVECEVVGQDWDGMIPALQQGKYDAIMAAMSINEERLKVIDFGGPYANEPTAFAAPKDSPLVTFDARTDRVDLAKDTAEGKAALDALAKALDGKTVGAQTSTLQASFVERYLKNATLRTYDKLDSAGIDLSAGRLDAIVGDRSAAEAVVKTDAANIVMFGPDFVNGVLGQGMGVGLRKADTDLKALFNKAIDEANKDGTIARLSTQWFGYDISVK